MKMTAGVQSSILAGFLFVAGCGTTVHEPSTMGRSLVEPRNVTQEQARQLTGQYSRRAAELRTLADRTEWEAQWYAGRFGADDRQANDLSQQARQLWAAAAEADQLAHEYRRQVPHGQMQ